MLICCHWQKSRKIPGVWNTLLQKTRFILVKIAVKNVMHLATRLLKESILVTDTALKILHFFSLKRTCGDFHKFQDFNDFLLFLTEITKTSHVLFFRFEYHYTQLFFFFLVYLYKTNGFFGSLVVKRQ